MQNTNILIVGSSSGLGAELLARYANNSVRVTGISRYQNKETFANHSEIARVVKMDLLDCQSQDSFKDAIKGFELFSHCIFCIGGGYGINAMLPSYEDLLLLLKLNLLIPTSLLKGLVDEGLVDLSTKICFISSIAAEEAVASVSYTSAKAALNAYSKVISKKDNNVGPVLNIKLGAVEGSGAAFDRLKLRDIGAYQDFCNNRLNGEHPMRASDVAEFIVKLLDSPASLLNGLTIKLDNSESLSI